MKKEPEDNSALELASRRRAKIFLEEAIIYMSETLGKDETIEYLLFWVDTILEDNA
jgi:hypothetical protein